MDYTKTALAKEVEKILTEGNYSTEFTYDIFLYVKKTNKTYLLPKMISIDVFRDYINNYTDKTVITAAITGGIYTHDIFPYKDGLDVLVRRTPVFNAGSKKDLSRQTLVERFTAVLIDPVQPTVYEKETPNKSTLDLTNLMEIQFDCISKTAEELNMIIVGGVPRNVTGEQVIKSVLTNEACQGGNDQNVIVKGVDMVPATNTEIRDHIILPQGLKLIDLPNYIQNKAGGVYSTGLGYYLQERYWYVYPAYDYTRINDTDRVITFLALPPRSLPSVEKTFRHNGKQVIAIATGNLDYTNDVDIKLRNMGNGVSFSVASTFMHNKITVGGNQAIADRGASNTEAKTIERSDTKTFMPVSNNPITDNAMAEFSRLAAGQAATISLLWQHSDPTQILPGTLARVYYVDDGGVKDIVGSIIAVQHYTHLRGKGMSQDTYNHNTSVTIAVKPV